jgi:predicted AlkP superfamily phosphohydrolase/phosphomutase
MNSRLLIVGWDGADWEVVDDLVARGCLPNVARMLEAGSSATLISTIPTHSWAAWPTFLTGMSPAGHGVFDFMERNQARLGKRTPIFSASIRAETFLERLSRHGHEVRAGNIPVTFPPLPIRGRMIAGGAIPPGANVVFPPGWAEELEAEAPFPVNGMEWMRFRHQPFDLLEEARSMVERRGASFRALLRGDWSVAVCVFVVTDRLQHPFADHLFPSHPDHAALVDTPLAEAIRGIYRLLDEELARLAEAAGSDTTLMLVSDHGFEAVTRASSTTGILARQGLARPSRSGTATATLHRSSMWQAVAATRLGRAVRKRIPTPSAMHWSKTVAYGSASGGGVSINLKGREPEGVVDPRDHERVREEVRDALLAFEDDELGKPIADVLRSEEVFSGAYADLAPDLVAVPSASWVLDHTDLAATRLAYPTGDHRREGVLIAAGEGIPARRLGVRDLADVAPTALAFCGVPSPDLDGTPIGEIAGGDAPVPVATDDELVPVREGVGLSASEFEDVTQHLRDLGYVD